MDRRRFLVASASSGAMLPFGPDFWRSAYAEVAQPGPGPYGSIEGREPDENGVVLPEGFRSRLLASSGSAVEGTEYVWHTAPDGGATFVHPEGGWVYVSNSELPDVGGVSAIRFDEEGAAIDAYRILSDTSRNCAGGITPWGTWLSCEEFDYSGADDPSNAGQVWECDPLQPGQGEVRPALGKFNHEAAAVDPDLGLVYLTEDTPTGRLYRFTPDNYPDLTTGLLEAAAVDQDGSVSWVEVPDPGASTVPTRDQVPDATVFSSGEGMWWSDGFIYFTTKGDNRVHAIETATDRYEVIYDAAQLENPPLTGIDNLTVEMGSGDLFVAEDPGLQQVVLITPERVVAPFLRVMGHTLSELTGPAFSPDGRHLYFSSQRGVDGGGFIGQTFVVTGPFRGVDLLEPTPAPTTTLGEVGSLGSTTTVAAAAASGADESSGESGDDAPVVVIGGIAAGAALVAGAVVALRRRGQSDS